MRRLELFLDAKAANTPPRGISKASRVIFPVLTLLFLSIGQMWGAEGDTHDFSQSLSQLLNSNNSINSINIAEQSYPIKEIIVSFRYNNSITNAVTMEASVGGISWGTAYSEGTGSNYKTRSFTHTSASGAITISFTNNTGSGTGHGTFYVNNVRLVEGAPAQKYDVHWSINGVVVEDENLSGKPSVPTDVAELAAEEACGGKSFVGWTANENYSHATTAPTDLFTDQAKTAISEETTYYAVYANVEVGEDEDVAYSFLTSDDTSESTTAGWSITNPTTSYAATYGATWLRNNNASLPIFAFTPKSNVSKIILRVRQSNATGSNTVACTVGGAAVGTTQGMSGTSQYNMTFTPTTASKGQIIITCTNTSGTGNSKGSFYVASITLTQKSITYSNYTVTCCSTLNPIYGSVSASQPEGCDKKKVEWTIPVDGSSEKKAAGVILKLYADDNNAKGSEITAKAADYSSDNTTTTHTFEGLEPSTKYWFTVTLIGITASGVTYCNSEEGTAVSFETAAASNSWTITYNANGEGVTNMPTETYADKTSGEGTLSSTVPVRAGYTFLGWDKVDDAESATYAAGGAITGVDDDTDLYAIWEQRTVTLNAGSGTASGSPLTPNAQGKVTLPSATPSAACAEIGWEFVGWAETEATGVKPATIIPAGEYTPAAKMTLYAVYGELGNTYTKITNAADFTSGNYVFAIAAGKALNNELNSDNKAAGKNVSITSGTTISTTSSDADIIWQVTKSSDNYTLYNAAITKYLNIVPNTSDNYGHLELEADSRNYTVDMSNGDVRLWAPGKSSNQVIEYYNAFTCYGSVNNSALIYAFKQDYDSYATSPNCTAYTLGKAVDPADKGNVALGKTSLLPGAQTTAEATPIDGYRFLNWTITGTGATMSNTSEGKSTDNPVTVTMGSENATITAHFEEIPSHDVKFSVNGSVVDGLTLNLEEGASIPFWKESDVTLPDYTDKRFVGWIENSTIADPAVAPSFVTSAVVGNADKTYYAVMADVIDGDYEKLTSATGLTAGDRLVITDGIAVGMKAYEGTNNNFRGAVITIENDKITSLGEAAEVTLGGETDAWTLYDGAKYLYAASSTSNHMKGADAADNDNCKWTITYNAGTATVKSNTTTNRAYMRFNENNGSPIFSCYANSNDQSEVVLFKKAISATDFVTTVAPLDHIAISGTFQTTYKKGATLNLDGMVVTATYGTGGDARDKELANDAYTVDLAGELLSTTDVKFVVSFGGKTANQTINVYALTGLSVTTGPTKTEYNAGESFDPAGMVVDASWGNGAITNPNVTGYTYSTDPLTNGTDHNITVDVTITYTSAGDEVTTTQEVTVIPRPSLTMTWNVAGSTTTSEIFANAQDKYLLALPENNPNPVDAGFTSDFVFKGWTKATSVNKDGTSIDYAAANDEQTQAETFYAVFAQKNGEDIPAGYKLKDEAPEAGETIIFARKVSETYYAFTKTASTSAMTITNGIVSSSTDDILWDPKTTCGTSTATGLFYFVSDQTTNLIHMNTSSFNITNGATNGDIVFSSNGDGSYKATRADGARWIVTNGTNGLGVSATESNAAALYIFKYSAASYATYSNYRLAPSSVKAPTGLTAGTYYCTSKAIELAQEDSKAIYYTTNGDVPTNASTLYEGQFSVNASCTIKAVAYDAGEQDYSAVVEAEYVIVSSIDAPTMPASKTFYGTSESVEIEHALTTEGAVIRYSFDDVDYNDYSAALNITATTTVYAYATIGSLTSDKVSATYTKGEAVTYKKVTSAAELVPGMKFIIVSGTNAAKAGTPTSTGSRTYLNEITGLSITSGEVEIGEQTVAVFELGGKPGEYTMTAAEGQLGATAAKRMSYTEGVATWDITFDGENNVTIASTESSYGDLQYNSNGFTTYTSSQTAVEIYMQKPGYERTVREGYYGTICLPNGGKMIGTTLYEIAYYDAVEEKIFFDEVLDGNMVAGMPYIFQPVEGAQKLYQYSNASHADSPVPAADANGLVGNLGSTITLSAGDYFLYNNQYYVVSASETRTISVPQYYAYIDMSEVSHQPTSPQPNRRRIAMSVHGEQVATDIDILNASEAPVKVMIDGKFYILRGEKMYDATGKLVK